MNILADYSFMEEETFRQKALCITGNRPHKLPKGEKLALLKKALFFRLDEAIEHGFRAFFDGMADGVDYYAAEYLFQKRGEIPDIQVIGVQPFDNYEEFFERQGYDLNALHRMREACDYVICLKGEYVFEKKNKKNNNLFMIRNDFLVNHSSAEIAVCSPTNPRSGSAHTYRYAKEKALPICRIEPKPNLTYTPTPEQYPVEKINWFA